MPTIKELSEQLGVSRSRILRYVKSELGVATVHGKTVFLDVNQASAIAHHFSKSDGKANEFDEVVTSGYTQINKFDSINDEQMNRFDEVKNRYITSLEQQVERLQTQVDTLMQDLRDERATTTRLLEAGTKKKHWWNRK